MGFVDRYGLLRNTRRRYEIFDPSHIEVYQLQRFNMVWGRALRENPFYEEWAKSHSLPAMLNKLSDLSQFPLLTRHDIVENEDLIFQGLSDVKVRQTGGSTGQPARFPSRKDESDQSWASVYTARGWWGIRPRSKLTLIWGHSHLYGAGKKRILKVTERRVRDLVTRTQRLDAYQDSDEHAALQLQQILDYEPEYIVGYTSAVERLARIATDSQRDHLASLNLKAVIVTGETIDAVGETSISAAFSAPVVIEYGASEFGVVAHSRFTTWNLQVLWAHCIATITAQNELVVSTLTDRAFPLINYATGDIVEVIGRFESGSITELSSVQGRMQNKVKVRMLNGESVTMSALQPSAIVRSNPEVIGLQLEQMPNCGLRVHVKLSDSSSLNTVAERSLKEFKREYPDLDPASFMLVETNDLELTVAGKAKLFRGT